MTLALHVQLSRFSNLLTHGSDTSLRMSIRLYPQACFFQFFEASEKRG